jgi:hypothetical protein
MKRLGKRSYLYPAEYEIEREAIIGSMPFDASQDAIKTSRVGVQPM